MSAYWRWPGVWSISETSRTCGSSANSPNSSRQSSADDLAAHVDRVIGAQQAGVGRQLDRVRQAAGRPRRWHRAGRAPTPMRTASSTVVAPAAASCASLASTAGSGSHCTPGRGVKWYSRWSVCSSTRPGSRWSPSRSSPRRAARVRADVGDQAVADQDRAVPDLLVEDDAGVAEDGFAASSSSFAVCRLRRDAACGWPAAAGAPRAASNGAPGSASVNRASASTGTVGPEQRGEPVAQGAFHRGLPLVPGCGR